MRQHYEPSHLDLQCLYLQCIYLEDERVKLYLYIIACYIAIDIPCCFGIIFCEYYRDLLPAYIFSVSIT